LAYKLITPFISTGFGIGFTYEENYPEWEGIALFKRKNCSNIERVVIALAVHWPAYGIGASPALGVYSTCNPVGAAGAVEAMPSLFAM
jgi:hypothetical protein